MAKAPSAAQLAARKKFAAAARAGTLKAGKRAKPARKRAKPARKVVATCSVRKSNPIGQRVTYKVQARNAARSIWQTVVTTHSEKEARATAKMLHGAYPSRAYRVIDNSDD